MAQMKSTLTVLRSVADSPAKLRPCDAWRLYESAATAGCIPQVRHLIAINIAALEAFNAYESEIMTAIHQPELAEKTA